MLIPLSLGWFYHIAFQSNGTKIYLLKRYLPVFGSINDFFIFFFIVISVYALIYFLSEFQIRKLNEKFNLSVRNELVEAQLNHTLSANRKKTYGKYLLRFSGDLSSIQNMPRFAIVQPISDFLFLFICGLILLSLSKVLFLFEALWILLTYGLIFQFNTQVKSRTIARRDQLSINLNWITQRLAHFDSVKIFNRSKLELKRFQKKSQHLYNKGLAYAQSIALMKTLPKIFFGLNLFLLLVFISFLNQKGSSLLARDCIAFILVLFYLRSTLDRNLTLAAKWKIASVALHKIIAIIEEPKEAFLINNQLKFDNSIEMTSLDFAYNDNYIFNGFNLSIKSASITLIEGYSQTGKTTLIKLLTQQILPTNGQIQIGKYLLNEIEPATWRKQFSLISEELNLFGSTVFQAISYSTTANKRKKASQLLKLFQLTKRKDAEAILSQKLDTYMNESTDQERIILKFIRAFLTNKPFIFIDDLIHKLDFNNQALVCNYLQNLGAQKTVIITSNQAIKALHHDQKILLPDPKP